MNILLVTSLYPTQDNSVIGSFVKGQVGVLRERGIGVFVAATSISTVRDKLTYKYSELAWQTVKHLNKKFDIVHVHYPTIAGVYGGLVALLFRKPYIVTIHGGEIDDVLLKDMSAWKRWITRGTAIWSMKHADVVIAVGEDLRKLIIQEGIPEDKIELINMGIDRSIFYPRPKDQIRHALGINIGNPLIVFAGWLIDGKGPEYFIRAAALLKNKHPQCKWYLLGSGPLKEPLLRLSDDLKIKDQVVFLGRLESEGVAKWDAAADVFVMPSLAESFGLSGIEALSCGTPVVASNVGGLKSYVIDGVNGFLVDPANAESIASKVDLLLINRDLQNKMGQSGIETAKKYDFRDQTDKVINIYRKILKSTC